MICNVLCVRYLQYRIDEWWLCALSVKYMNSFPLWIADIKENHQKNTVLKNCFIDRCVIFYNIFFYRMCLRLDYDVEQTSSVLGSTIIWNHGIIFCLAWVIPISNGKALLWSADVGLTRHITSNQNYSIPTEKQTTTTKKKLLWYKSWSMWKVTVTRSRLSY